MQVMAQQTAAAERAETRKREREEREEARREREEERKDQRRREERREDLFLSLVGIGIAMASGRNNEQIDPSELLSSFRRQRSNSDDKEK